MNLTDARKARIPRKRKFPKGRGHSSGILHDPKRRLVWGVDASCRAYVLRLDPATADVQEMR